MFSSSLDALLKLSKTTPSQKLFDYDDVTLYQNAENYQKKADVSEKD